MNALTRGRVWVEEHTDILYDLVRIYLGVGLFFKGIYFAGHRDHLVQLMDSAGASWALPAAMAHYIILAHLCGGVLLALGLITRLGAIIQLPILLFAVLYLYLPKMMFLEPRQNLEFSALVLFLLALFSVFGSGRLSLDHYLSRRISGTPPAVTPQHGISPTH